MRRLTRVRPLAAILLFPVTTAALALAAHSADDPTPLAGWAAPPYWVQPAEPAARSRESKRPADLKARLARIEARLEAGNEHNGLQ